MQENGDKAKKCFRILNKEAIMQAKVRQHETQIDQLVYKLYGLTSLPWIYWSEGKDVKRPREIAIVEGKEITPWQFDMILHL